MIKIVKYFFQSIVIYLLFFIGFIFRLKIGRKIFASFFSLCGPLFKSKKIINSNLKNFSSRVSEIDEKQIANEMWRNYGMTFIEYLYLGNFKKNNAHIEIDGAEYLTRVKKNDKPVIFVSGHFANFELMSMEITKNNIQLATIYRPLNNIFLNPFMEFLRKKYVCKNQIKKGINGVKETINYIKNNYSIALMIDQRVSEGEKVSFFGKEALTTTLPAQLSFKFGLEIVPVFIERKKNNKFRIEFFEPIKPYDYENKIKLTEKLNSILEKMITNNPYQWIWTHNRWK